MQILRLRELEAMTDVVGLRRVNDDNALALLELVDDVVAVERGEHGHGDGDEEPEPRQTVALGEQLRRVEFLPGDARWGSAVASGVSRAEFGGFHMSVVMAFGLGDEFADGLSPVMSSPGRPRAEGGRPEPAMMIAPALPCPAALDNVLRIPAAMPAAPAVTAGNRWGGDGGCARGGGGGLEKLLNARDELSAREFPGENFLNDERRGDGAEHDPERPTATPRVACRE